MKMSLSRSVLFLLTCTVFFLQVDSKLTCYHCTKIITEADGKNTTTYTEYNTVKAVDECPEKECSAEGDKCYSLTTAKTDENSVSVFLSCGTSTKDAACEEVGGLEVDKCKTTLYTWNSCSQDLCNHGIFLRPIMILTLLTMIPAMILH
ncbi:hypothetical protein ACHWQZ_G016452 [Mnemiopsis leidyi]